MDPAADCITRSVRSRCARRRVPTGREAAGDTSGTLTVSDGTHTATLTLLGQYIAADFTKASDGGTGTLITDPPVTGSNPQALIAPAHHG